MVVGTLVPTTFAWRPATSTIPLIRVATSGFAAQALLNLSFFTPLLLAARCPTPNLRPVDIIGHEKENKMQKFHSDTEAEAYVKNAMSRIFSTATKILEVSEKHELPSPVIDAAQQISRMALTAYGQAYRPEATEALSEFFTPGKP